MRLSIVVCFLAVHMAFASVARADERAVAERLRQSGIGVIVVGVLATVAAQVLLGEGIGWELGNGLGEHYDATPPWVQRAETSAWVLLGTGQGAIVSGIALLAIGDSKRDRARAAVRLSLSPTANGAFATLSGRF